MVWRMAGRLWGLWWARGVEGRGRGTPQVVLPCLPLLSRFLKGGWETERRMRVMGRGRAGIQVQEPTTDKRCGRWRRGGVLRDKRGCRRVSCKGKGGGGVKRQGPW